MTDIPKTLISPKEKKNILFPKDLYFCDSLEPDEERQEQIALNQAWNSMNIVDDSTVQNFEDYLVKNGVHDLDPGQESEKHLVKNELSIILVKHKYLSYSMNQFLGDFDSIFRLSEKAFSLSKLKVLKRAFSLYGEISKMESASPFLTHPCFTITEYFRKWIKKLLLPKLEKVFEKDLLGSFRQIFEKRLRYRPQCTDKEYNVFAQDRSNDYDDSDDDLELDLGPQQLSTSTHNIFTLDRKNANLEDIFFAVNDFLPKNLIGRTNCTIIWERSLFLFEDKCVIESLNLCNKDSWLMFIGNLTDFFCVTRFTPIQEQINERRRSQEINMMKITSDLQDDSRVLHRRIKKLPKKASVQRNENNPGSKRKYLKKKHEYWINRKDLKQEEIIEYSRQLMDDQKEKDRKGPSTS